MGLKISHFLFTANLLLGAEVAVGDSFDAANQAAFNPLSFSPCNTIDAIGTPANGVTVTCTQPVMGRYAAVWVPRGILTVCEFQVYGKFDEYKHGLMVPETHRHLPSIQLG